MGLSAFRHTACMMLKLFPNLTLDPLSVLSSPSFMHMYMFFVSQAHYMNRPAHFVT